MKAHSFLLLSFLPFWLWAQTPEGRLYFPANPPVGGPTVLMQIDYPLGQPMVIDTFGVGDMIWADSQLWVVERDFSVLGHHLRKYDENGQLLNKTPEPSLYHMGIWNDQLISLHTERPYFRARSRTDLSQINFVLDSPTVNAPPVDLMVHKDTCWLLYPDSLAAVSLVEKDTVLGLPATTPFFPGLGPNRYLLRAGNRIFIWADFPTGVPRQAFLEVDRVGDSTRMLAFVEGRLNPYKPVVAGDSIHFYGTNSYFHLDTDSLFLSNDPDSLVVARDPQSEILFTYSYNAQQLSFLGAPEVQSIGFLVQNPLFVSSASPQSIGDIGPEVKKYLDIKREHNQSSLTIKNDGGPLMAIALLDLNGRRIYPFKKLRTGEKITWSIQGLSRGIYILKATSPEISGALKLRID